MNYDGIDFTLQGPPVDPCINDVYCDNSNGHLYICVEGTYSDGPPYAFNLLRQPLANITCVAGRFVIPSDNTIAGEYRPCLGVN